MKFFFITLAVLFITSTTSAQLSTSKLFSDHMVLQRNHNVPVWGKAAKKEKVTVSFNNQVITVKADEQGSWKAVLQPMKEGGQYNMKITSGKESITYSDIMLGEVWLCSGQSNMEFQLRNAYGYKAEQKTAAQVAVRQFLVQKKVSLTPEKDVTGQWTLAAANTIGDFSAVGYFFAKKLSQNLHVTVGIINSSWGGTEAEDWISRESMAVAPELSTIVPTLPLNDEQLKQRTDKQLKAWAYHNVPIVNYTPEDLASKPVGFFESWQKESAPGSWEWMGKLYSYRGEGFMQRSIGLDSSYTAMGSTIALGITDADLAVYVNGKLLNKNTANSQFDVPAGVWKAGANNLLINLKSAQKNPSWFGLGLNGVGNDINVRFADTIINMADGNWHVMPDLSKPYHFDFEPNNSAFTRNFAEQ